MSVTVAILVVAVLATVAAWRHDQRQLDELTVLVEELETWLDQDGATVAELAELDAELARTAALLVELGALDAQLQRMGDRA